MISTISNEIIPITSHTVKNSKFINDLELNNHLEYNTIQNKVNPICIPYIEKFFEDYNEHPFDEPEKPMKYTFDEWVSNPCYRTFIENIPMNILKELIECANYLHIQELLDLLCCYIASDVKYMKLEEIKIKYAEFN